MYDNNSPQLEETFGISPVSNSPQRNGNAVSYKYHTSHASYTAAVSNEVSTNLYQVKYQTMLDMEGHERMECLDSTTDLNSDDTNSVEKSDKTWRKNSWLFFAMYFFAVVLMSYLLVLSVAFYRSYRQKVS